MCLAKECHVWGNVYMQDSDVNSYQNFILGAQVDIHAQVAVQYRSSVEHRQRKVVSAMKDPFVTCIAHH
jgi:hypothetical protein